LAQCPSGWFLSESHLLKCTGTVGNFGDSATCSGEWAISYVGSPDPLAIDPVLFAGAVGAGFFFLVPLWVASYGAKLLINTIKTL